MAPLLGVGRRTLRLFYQPPKERRGKGVAEHALGMPLHTYRPARSCGPFQRFDDAIGRPSGDAQADPGPLRGLVMRAVYASTRSAGEFSQVIAFDPDGMKRLIPPVAAVVVHRVL